MTDVLEHFDREMPAGDLIQSESQLVSMLKMNKLVEMNEQNGSPYGTNLELRVYYFFKDSLAPQI